MSQIRQELLECSDQSLQELFKDRLPSDPVVQKPTVGLHSPCAITQGAVIPHAQTERPSPPAAPRNAIEFPHSTIASAS